MDAPQDSTDRRHLDAPVPDAAAGPPPGGYISVSGGRPGAPRARRTAGLRVSDLWTPDQPLPDGPVLEAIANRLAAIWELPELPRRCRIGYNPRLRTTAGRAACEEAGRGPGSRQGAYRVELNPHLLREHPEQLVPTLAHELAHVAVWLRYGRRTAPHGREFRTLMRAANLSDARCHDLPAARQLRRRRYLYLHRCSDCGQTFIARRPRRNVYCRKCGPEMTWDIFRAPASAAGREALERLKRGG